MLYDNARKGSKKKINRKDKKTQEINKKATPTHGVVKCRNRLSTQLTFRSIQNKRGKRCMCVFVCVVISFSY